MPPKKEEPPKLTRKQREALALQKSLDRAGDEARRNFAQQDKLRAQAERQARANHDAERFDRAAEVKRLTEEMTVFQGIGDEIVVRRRLALLEHAKLTGWRGISECSALPDPNSEPTIHRFLTAWREDQEGIADPIPVQETALVPNTDRRVVIKRIEQPAGSKDPYVTGGITAQRDDTPAPAEQRFRALDQQLGTAHAAVQLVSRIQAACDESVTRQKDELAAMHVRHQIEINEAILEAMDSITASVLNYIDAFVDPTSDDECVLRTAPGASPGLNGGVGGGPNGGGTAGLSNANPAIKFGLWKKSPRRVTVGSIDYGELGILIEPKDSSQLKLPAALKVGLKDNIVIRAMQFNFDPLSVLTPAATGQEFYALDCVIVLESLTHPDKPKKVGDWSVRLEAAGGPRELMRNEYPPRDAKSGTEKGGGTAAAAAADSDLMMKVTIEVPDTVALRAKHPTIGKWNPVTRLWDPCSTGRINTEGLLRRVTFLTSDLTALAIVQEKGFDVPYERWQIYPHSLDEVMVILEGRNQRNDASASQSATSAQASSVELRILVREQECCLQGPNDRELSHIRGRWFKPLTLMRLLSKAGYNFVLSDADAESIPSVLPRTNSLETRAYFDMSLFCLTHSFCSTRHNRIVEDPDMGLFRVSKEQRPDDDDTPFPVDTDDQGLWHSIRFETERVVVAEYNEDEDVPTLRAVAEHESHVNLYTVLQKLYGEKETHYRATVANPLVQDCVFNLLRLTRPLTWG